MNILVINGSPKGKRSNSLKLTQAFLQGFCEKKNSQGQQTTVEQIDVAQSVIEGCKGCFACWKATPGKCCIEDDMKQILDKQLWADLIVYSFPLYYFNVPGSLKNLIDRQLPMVLPFMSERQDGVGSGSHEARYDFSGKSYVLISTCGFYSAAGNYDSVRSMFDHICGKENYETIFCGQGELFGVKELSERTGAYLENVKKAGEEYADGRIGQKTRQKLQELLYPREIFEAMADASWGISRESGQKEDDSLIFTRQMAALYNPRAYDGKDRVLEMCYTDLGRTYQILLEKDKSTVFADGTLTATTRIETPYSVWQQIARNEIRGDVALARQMYRVTGDFSMMLEWDKFFGPDQKEQNFEAGSRKPSSEGEKTSADSAKTEGGRPPVMTTMLAAWIIFWVAVSVNPRTGALIALGVCAMLPLLMYRHKLAIYDRLSIAAAALLSVFTLISGKGSAAVNLGYLLFGLMWLLSCLTKEPLCACYVKYEYNGNEALENPIFMKTNYILAAGWGVLYVLIAVWTFFLSRTPLAGYLVIINNIMPALMGIFTGWFQCWYPAWVAAGKH